MKIGSIALTLGFIAISMVFFVVSRDFNPGAGGDLGSGAFPQAIATLAMICCVGIVVTEIRKGTMDKVLTNPVIKSLCLVACTLAYVFVMEIVGFIFATPIIILAYLYFLNQRSHLLNLAFSFGLTAATYYAFGILFHVRIPQSFLGI